MRFPKTYFRLILPLAVSLAAPSTGGASTILSNLINGSSFAADASNGLSSWIGISWTMGVTDYQLTGTKIYLTNQGGLTGSAFSISMWSDNAGSPGAFLAPLTPSGTAGYITTTPASTFTMTAGTTYWLIIVNSKTQFRLFGGLAAPTGTDAAYVGVEQAATGVGAVAAGANPIAGVASPAGTPAYFELNGNALSSATPEPASFGLAAAAILGMLVIRCQGLKRAGSSAALLLLTALLVAPSTAHATALLTNAYNGTAVAANDTKTVNNPIAGWSGVSWTMGVTD